MTCCFAAAKRQDEAEGKADNSIWRWGVEGGKIISSLLFPFCNQCRCSMSLFSQLSAAAYMDRPCISAVVTAKKEGWFDDRNFLLLLQISGREVEQLSCLFVKSWGIFDPCIVVFSTDFPSSKGLLWSLHGTRLLRASEKGETSFNSSGCSLSNKLCTDSSKQLSRS